MWATRLPSRLEVTPLTTEQWDELWAAISRPVSVEDYKWWIGKKPQMGKPIEEPPTPSYMELFT